MRRAASSRTRQEAPCRSRPLEPPRRPPAPCRAWRSPCSPALLYTASTSPAWQPSPQPDSTSRRDLRCRSTSWCSSRRSSTSSWCDATGCRPCWCCRSSGWEASCRCSSPHPASRRCWRRSACAPSEWSWASPRARSSASSAASARRKHPRTTRSTGSRTRFPLSFATSGSRAWRRSSASCGTTRRLRGAARRTCRTATGRSRPTGKAATSPRSASCWFSSPSRRSPRTCWQHGSASRPHAC